jgi:hypothetical protein
MAEVVRTSSLRPNTRPIDPDVVIPAAVKRAAAAAEAAQRAAYPENNPPAEPAPPKPGDTIQIAEPPATPQPAPVTPTGNPAPQPDPQPQPTPQTPADPNDQTWEHKYNSERGRHANTKKLLDNTTERVTALEQLVHEMSRQPAAPAAPAAPATPATKLVTEQEENEFGTEMLDVMGRRAREIVTPELIELRNTVKSLEQKLTGTVQNVSKNARASMLSKLDSDMPEWRNVNNLSEFKAWLALPDPYFGVTRHSALLSAFEQNDTPRVLNFFKGFVSELAVTTPADEPTTVLPTAPQPAKPGLEALAAPGRARTPAQSNVPAEKQIITTADINAFYRAKAAGAYSGREAEFTALEQELFKAQREGRVRAV